MANSKETGTEAEYDEILSKLDALLRKHETPPATNSVDPPGGSSPDSSVRTEENLAEAAAPDPIPTLTDMLFPAQMMPSHPTDPTSLLEQILDSVLRDTGINLAVKARVALVQALKQRLFGP